MWNLLHDRRVSITVGTFVQRCGRDRYDSVRLRATAGWSIANFERYKWRPYRHAKPFDAHRSPDFANVSRSCSHVEQRKYVDGRVVLPRRGVYARWINMCVVCGCNERWKPLARSSPSAVSFLRARDSSARHAEYSRFARNRIAKHDV